MAVTTRLTAEQFPALPGGPPFYELVEGELVLSEASDHHEYLVLEIVSALREWTRGAPGRGRASIAVDVRVDDRNVFAPDVWWNPGPARPPKDSTHLTAPPALVVEVRSPSTWRYDVGAKRAAYERAGLPELWLVDRVAETVLLHRRSAPGAQSFDVALEVTRGHALTSPQLPGFAMQLEALFGS